MQWISKLQYDFRLLYVCVGFFSAILTAINCKDVSNRKTMESNLNKLSNDSLSNLYLAAEIDLYPYDTFFNQFLPDTSLSFSSNKLLKTYLFEKYRTMDSVLGSWQSKDSTQTFAVKRTAQIIYADHAQALRFKYYKDKKDQLSLSILSDYSPFSRIITLEDRLAVFNSYPIAMQQNDIGRKTLAHLEKYAFKANIGKSFTPFYDENIIVSDEKTTSLRTLLDQNAAYHIFVFGASWCSPCILEERMLKYWYKDIDPAKVQIVGFSVDDNMNKWKKYTTEENYPWKMVLLPKAFDNRISKAFELGNGIPMNFLVNSSGQILVQNTDIRRILKNIPELNIKRRK